MDGLCVGAPMLNVGQEFDPEENRGFGLSSSIQVGADVPAWRD